MKNNQLICENSRFMYYSRELIHLKTPKEINFIFYSILSIIVLVFISLFCVKINDVIKVKGIVRAKENSSEIQNIIPGTITEKNYKPNQFVNAGDVLYKINDKDFTATMKVLEAEYKNTLSEIECTDAMLEGIETNKNNYKDDEYIGTQINDYLKTVSYMNRQIEINKYQYDYEKNLPSSIKNSKSIKEAYLKYKLSQDELAKYKASYKAQLENSRKNLLASKVNLEQQIEKTKNTYSYLEVKAPVSGYVQEITLLNPGDYVFANQKILKIIPTDNNEFRVQLSVPTKDIGEITEGIDVKYRLSAFPFFEFRGAQGKIVSIDPDIRQNDSKQYVYLVYSDIDKTSFKNYAGQEYPLRSGIEVDARIVMNKIQLASFIFRKMGYIK